MVQDRMKRGNLSAICGNLLSWATSHESTVAASIIVSVRRCPSYLDLLLASLVRQRIPSNTWEVIIAGGAEDDTLPVVTRYARILPRLRNIPGMQRPWGSLLDEAVNKARGRILIFLRDDRLVPPDFILQHLRCHTHGELVALGADHGVICTHMVTDDDPAEPGIAPQPMLVPSDLDDPALLSSVISTGSPDYTSVSDYIRRGGVPAWSISSGANRCVFR